MKKVNFVPFFIFLILLVSMFSFLLAEQKAVVKVDRANIRRQPDRQASVLIVVTRGTTLDVLGKEGEWYHVSLVSQEKGALSGYIHQDLVELIKEEERISGKEDKVSKEQEAQVRPASGEKVSALSRPSRLRALGIKIGYSGASLYGENVEEFEEYLQYEMKTKGGLNLGGFIIVNLNPYLALQSELNYVQKGAKTGGEAAGEEFKAWINLSYLEIPALLRFYLPSQSDFNFSIYAGTYVGLKTRARAKAEVAGIKAETDIENIKSTDAGLIFGASFDFSPPLIKGGQLSFDLRYTLGLTSIATEPEVETKNKVFSVSLAYLFKF